MPKSPSDVKNVWSMRISYVRPLWPSGPGSHGPRSAYAMNPSASTGRAIPSVRRVASSTSATITVATMRSITLNGCAVGNRSVTY
jgi:hypothetical protein